MQFAEPPPPPPQLFTETELKYIFQIHLSGLTDTFVLRGIDDHEQATKFKKFLALIA
jgi:hypothetical protein